MHACSALCHPHIQSPKAVFRNADWLYIVQDCANGGTLFGLVKRCGGAGLPEPAARFLIQQLVLTVTFAHTAGVLLQEISPAKLLIAWSPKGMPLLKTNLLRTPQRLGAADQVLPQRCASD